MGGWNRAGWRLRCESWRQACRWGMREHDLVSVAAPCGAGVLVFCARCYRAP